MMGSSIFGSPVRLAEPFLIFHPCWLIPSADILFRLSLGAVFELRGIVYLDGFSTKCDLSCLSYRIYSGSLNTRLRLKLHMKSDDSASE